MIISTMSYAEAYRDLEREREQATRWWMHQLRALRRTVLKNRNPWPLVVWHEWQSPGKNRYLFLVRIFDKRMSKMVSSIAVVANLDGGLTVFTSWPSRHCPLFPMVMLPHAWARYRDRTGCIETGEALVRRYFERNPSGQHSRNQKSVGRSVRYNGMEHLSCCVPDGVLLGQMVDGIYVVRTFITYDMAHGLQAEDFEYNRQYIESDRELYELAKMGYII